MAKKAKPTTEIAIDTKFSQAPDAISRIGKDIGQRDYSESYKRQIMYQWLDYANTAQRRLSLESFATQKGLCRDTIKNWAKKDKWIQRMLEEGQGIIADNRKDKALFKEVDKDVFKWTQDECDIEWKNKILFFIQKQLDMTTDPKQFQEQIRDIMRDYESRN